MKKVVLTLICFTLVLGCLIWASPRVSAAEADTNFDDGWLERMENAELSVLFQTVPHTLEYGVRETEQYIALSGILKDRLESDPRAFLLAANDVDQDTLTKAFICTVRWVDLDTFLKFHELLQGNIMQEDDPSTSITQLRHYFVRSYMQYLDYAEWHIVFATSEYVDGAYAQDLSTILRDRFAEDPFGFAEALSLESSEIQERIFMLFGVEAKFYPYLLTIADLIDPEDIEDPAARQVMIRLQNEIRSAFNEENPGTGDPIGIFAGLMAVSGLAAAALVWRRKKAA